MRTTRRRIGTAAILAVLLLAGLPALAQEDKKIDITGTFYTKWLGGSQRLEGSLYNFSTVGEEPGGDSGQGTEIEIFIDGRLSKYLSFKSRIHSRFSQNFWTGFGGFSVGNNGGGSPGNCTGGDCGELDPRSNKYIKLRGATFFITPGWKAVDSIVVGASDLGMWDPATVGKIRYIDRDNAAGVFVSGATPGRKVQWDLSRISLPRLWAGPNFTTGDYTSADGAYVLQGKFSLSSAVGLTGIFYHTRDVELDPQDVNFYDGRELRTRFRNSVGAAKIDIRPGSTFDAQAAWYHSTHDSQPIAGAPGSFNTYFGFSPVIAGKHDDDFWKANLNFNNLADSGVSINVEAFDVGAEYASMLAARRESDVLLTEGFDATWMLPGLDNNTFTAFPSNRSQIGYGGYNGTRQQVATINADNNFSDFDEPLAETVIGWKGFTLVPKWVKGALELAGEYTWIDYNTNWQAYGDATRFIGDSLYPAHELDAGVLHNYRTAYVPFQDKETQIGLVRFQYGVEVGNGLDIFGKVKWIDEQDDRMTDPTFLPYAAGDCNGTGACANVKNLYNDVHSTADSNAGGPGLYENPPFITVTYPDASTASGYQWKPFDDVTDDDRDLSYLHLQVGAGYQFTDKLRLSLALDHYDADLVDGNSAFQAYGVHQWASGKHKKDSLDLLAKYQIPGGGEFGLEWQYFTGTFEPNYGDGFVPQVADAQDNAKWGAPIGSLGFRGRSFYGAGNYVWNSLEKVDLTHHRLKAFLKILW